MCTELGDRHNMVDYVEEYGKTSLCLVAGGETKNCNEQEKAYIAKISEAGAEPHASQLARLVEMEADGLSADLEEWAIRRIRILNQLLADSSRAGSDEL